MMGKPSEALFSYNPSQGAAVLFTVLFGLTTILHIIQAIRIRTQFVIPLIVGGIRPCLDFESHENELHRPVRPVSWYKRLISIVEAIGYIARIILSGQTPN